MGPIEKDTVTTLKVRGRNKDQMYLVRKKSTGIVRSKSPGFVCYTCKSTTVCVCDVGRGRVVCIVCQSTTVCACSRGRSLRVVCIVCQSTTVCVCGKGRVRNKSPAVIPNGWLR
jgi:hypothetical protein